MNSHFKREAIVLVLIILGPILIGLAVTLLIENGVIQSKIRLRAHSKVHSLTFPI